MLKILVLGSGGREHAIAWKLGESPTCKKVYLHPGNGGTVQAGIETLGDIPASVDAISDKAKVLGIDLCVIGPEAMLAEGYADKLRSNGFLVVGPGREAAKLESSKLYAKRFMQTAAIPTASYKLATSKAELIGVSKSFPLALKYDGLAAGKGVAIAFSENDVCDFAKRVWDNKEFGENPGAVIVEDFIEGKELSYMGLCDGKTFVPLESASDYKRLLDRNAGPNTGGMGAISPSPYFSEGLQSQIHSRIINPLLCELGKMRLDYCGVLYVGLIVDSDGKAHVLEFNARFGDPETQAVLLRLQSDFAAMLLKTANRSLYNLDTPTWSPKHSVYVVAAAEGYPHKPRTGDGISGLENVADGCQVFVSGVKKVNHALVTHGGRVLGIGSLGTKFSDAREKVYKALSQVRWRGMHYRTDIGADIDGAWE